MLKHIIPSLLILCLPLAGADKDKPLPKDIPSLKALAEKRNARAQYALGFKYRNGIGVKKDYAKALEWYRKAAEQGHARAQNKLGSAYFYGDGGLEDYVMVRAWWNITDKNRHQKDKGNNSELVKKMTLKQIAKAEALAKEMVKKNSKLLNK